MRELGAFWHSDGNTSAPECQLPRLFRVARRSAAVIIRRGAAGYSEEPPAASRACPAKKFPECCHLRGVWSVSGIEGPISHPSEEEGWKPNRGRVRGAGPRSPRSESKQSPRRWCV